MRDKKGDRKWGSGCSDLDVLQGQVLSLASSVGTKAGQHSTDGRKDADNSFDCHVYINADVCAATQEIHDNSS